MAVELNVLLSGLGALLAGCGAAMSGYAALHLARKGDREEKTPDAADG